MDFLSYSDLRFIVRKGLALRLDFSPDCVEEGLGLRGRLKPFLPSGGVAVADQIGEVIDHQSVLRFFARRFDENEVFSRGHKRTPAGSHIRRVNPRDALKDSLTNIRLHRVLRRGFAYGPLLPEDAIVNDGVDRGIMLAIINADPGRQFEFAQAQWVNDGDFISQGARTDPIVGRKDNVDDFQYPVKPIRRRVAGLPAFTATRGGEHVFLPGIAGLLWLTERN